MGGIKIEFLILKFEIWILVTWKLVCNTSSSSNSLMAHWNSNWFDDRSFFEPNLDNNVLAMFVCLNVDDYGLYEF